MNCARFQQPNQILFLIFPFIIYTGFTREQVWLPNLISAVLCFARWHCSHKHVFRSSSARAKLSTLLLLCNFQLSPSIL